MTSNLFCCGVPTHRQGIVQTPDRPEAAEQEIRDGRFGQIRPSISCYLCVAEDFFDVTPFCAVNPALANEVLLPLKPASLTKPSSSAPPAGMETAWVLTERGHSVTVMDKTDRLGGTMWFSNLTTRDNEPAALVQVRGEGAEHRGQAEHPGQRGHGPRAAPNHIIVSSGAVRYGHSCV